MRRNGRFLQINFLRVVPKKSFAILAILALILGVFNFGRALALDGAKWTSDSKSSINYGGKTFVKVEKSTIGDLPDSIKSKSQIYRATSSTGVDNSTQEFIGLDDTDDASSGTYAKFKVSPLGNLQQEGSEENISVDGVDKSKNSTSCAVEGGGGWAICMVANTLSAAMDTVFDFLKSFLKVQPLYVTNKSALFQVWDYTRNIANIVFVVAFLVVIYSQITNLGVSNYNIKKMLPKIIVAAILINLSYYICAIAVDLSNIIGAQFQDMLVGIRNEIFKNSADTVTVSGFTWKGLMAALLSGTGAVTYGVWAFAIGGGVPGLAISAVIMLLSVLYSAFVALVILAARQAIIILLVFLSPLAFAANIFPNTEKWYEKWKDLMTTMLVMYPLISLLFGGSQLAGTTIIASANGSFLLLMLGLMVQVIPLAITPTIMKLSGSLLGKFAGIINNPNKGPIDSAKNFLRDQKDDVVQRKIGNGNNFTAIAHQFRNNRRSRFNSNKRVAEDEMQARFYQREMDKLDNAREIKDEKARDRAMSRSTIWREMQADIKLNSVKANLDGVKKELQAEILKFPLKVEVGENGEEIMTLSKERIEKLNKKFGKGALSIYKGLTDQMAHTNAAQNSAAVIANSLANVMKRDEELQFKSQGARGSGGRTVAVARAMQQAEKLNNEEKEAANSLMRATRFTDADYAESIHGYQVLRKANGDADRDTSGNLQFVTDQSGARIKLDSVVKDGMKLAIDDTLKKAAIGDYMNKISLEEAKTLLGETGSGGDLHSIRGDLVKAFKEAKKDDIKVLGEGFFGNAALHGTDLTNINQEMVKGFVNKTSPEILSQMSDEALKSVFSQPLSGAEIQKAVMNLAILNHSKLAEKVKGNQGSEIHSFIDNLRASGRGSDVTAGLAQAEAALKAKDPNFDAIDPDFKSIVKKP